MLTIRFVRKIAFSIFALGIAVPWLHADCDFNDPPEGGCVDVPPQGLTGTVKVTTGGANPTATVDLTWQYPSISDPDWVPDFVYIVRPRSNQPVVELKWLQTGHYEDVAPITPSQTWLYYQVCSGYNSLGIYNPYQPGCVSKGIQLPNAGSTGGGSGGGGGPNCGAMISHPYAGVTAVSRNTNHLDLFATSTDGYGFVSTAQWTAGTPWSGAVNVNGNGPMIPLFRLGTYSPATAVSANPNQLDVFAIGNDGIVYTSRWTGDSGWSSSQSIGGFFPRRAPIAAVSRSPNQIDLFVVGNDGIVYTSSWTAGSYWSGINNNWRPIGGFFPAGAPIAAVSRNQNQLDLFVVGNDGIVYTSSWTAGSDWSGINNYWRRIGGFFPAGAPVAAVSRNPDQLDLFVTGNDGRVYSSWWTTASDWSGVNNNWRPIGGLFPAGAPIAAVSRNPNQLDLFVTGNDGRVYSSWWTTGSDWYGMNNNWRPIGGFFPAGAPVAAVSRNPDQLDLFIIGNDRQVYTSSWTARSDWSGVNNYWLPIFPADSSCPRTVETRFDITEVRLQGSWTQADLSAFVAPAYPAAEKPFAYVTPDGISRVVYRGVDNHIHELRRQGGWYHADLSAIVGNSAPAYPAAGRPFAYVTPDGVPRVVYRGVDNHIHELRLQGGWYQADLSAVTMNSAPAFPAVGNPFPYVTHDGIPRVVYLGSDAHIHELRLQGGWYQADLSAVTMNSAPALPAGGDPFAYITPDGIPRVVYLGLDTHIHELRLQGGWYQADLSAVTMNSAPAFPAVGNPFPYVTHDGIPRVVYLGSDAHIHELRLQGGWYQADLSVVTMNSAPAFPAAGDPFAYITPDGIPRVVYLGVDGDIHELRLQGDWYQADLSAIVTDSPPAVPAGSTPFAYFGSDGFARVLYLGAN